MKSGNDRSAPRPAPQREVWAQLSEKQNHHLRTPGTRPDTLGATREFWNSHPCDGDFDTVDQRLRYRYLKDYFIPALIKNHIPQSANVLEIGCGQGADLFLLSQQARRVTGVDLTPEGVARAGRFLKERGACNATVLAANAECLPFKDAAFDAVYSFGVMHHTPNTQACIDEAYRVLKPNGVAVIMLYRSWSPQYIIAKTMRGLTYPLRRSLAGLFSISMFRNSRFFGTALAEMFGVPVFKGFSYTEIQAMFRRFSSVHVERFNTGFARLRLITRDSPRLQNIWLGLEDKTRDTLGFFNVIVAKK